MHAEDLRSFTLFEGLSDEQLADLVAFLTQPSS